MWHLTGTLTVQATGARTTLPLIMRGCSDNPAANTRRRRRNCRPGGKDLRRHQHPLMLMLMPMSHSPPLSEPKWTICAPAHQDHRANIRASILGDRRALTTRPGDRAAPSTVARRASPDFPEDLSGSRLNSTGTAIYLLFGRCLS
jgi:hypothetical protein